MTIEVGPGRVEVLDRGPGLEPGEEEAVFERFHRGSAGRRGPGGTGLGLPIARELARQWGGEVTLRPREGGGTRASIELPAGLQPAERSLSPRTTRCTWGPATLPRLYRRRPMVAAMRWIGLALLGILIAAAVSIAASSLASQQIGLASQPISAGDALAPAREKARSPAARAPDGR